jgi:ribonucleoside-diphosphate reductase alpha chain
MSIKALQEYTRFSKYAKYVPEKKRRESWDEQVNRVFQMHKDQLGQEISDQLADELEFAERMVRKKRVLGSQRALQFGGKPILDKNARIYNCTVSYCDRPRFFQEGMYLLLCGCGIGFSVQKKHTDRLPNVQAPTKGKKTFVVEDSIEGWADSIGALLSSYFVGDKVTFPDCQGYDVEFDYSKVRPAGAPISSGSKAPGPDGLKASMIKIEKLLRKCCKLGDRLRSIDAYDIMMHASDAVLSGGVRRSATICLFSVDDQEMAKAKTGSWFIDNPQRGRSNNSVLLVRDDTTKEDFSQFIENIKEYGEPGIVWAENSDVVYNPCVEIGMVPKLPLNAEFRKRFADDIVTQGDNENLSGWEFCNMHVVPPQSLGRFKRHMRPLTTLVVSLKRLLRWKPS